MKNLLKVTLILGTLALIFFNVSLEKKDKNEDLNLVTLGQTSWAQSEVTQCLFNYVYSENTYVYKKSKCWRDQTGEDVFEGYVIECPGGGGGCQPTYCNTSIGSCYTTAI